jgi:DNA-binding Xre family transcriptional regulator
MSQTYRLRLKEVLKELGWTQRRLELETGISKTAIVNLVRGPMMIRFDTLYKLCRATGKTPNDLIIYDEPNQ